MADELALDTKAEAAATPQKALRRWLLEIKLADKAEKNWREDGKKVIDIYRGKTKKKNSFDILWANTEVLRPALYNSQPKPDVRRRFRQNDALGKAVSEVAERGAAYCVDAYDLDACLKNDVLDALLPGRGLSRVRYIPTIKSVTDPEQPATEENEKPHKDEAFEGLHEEVEYEQALCDHVDWQDFRHGPGRIWGEVMWVAFRQRMTRDDLNEKFGEEIAKRITLDDVDDAEIGSSKSDADLKDTFKRAALWEVWDKDAGKVFFVNESYRDGLLYPVGVEKGEPPLKLKNFFPCPQPLQMVEDTGSLIPIALFTLYKEQAEELDRISARITKITAACRVRFVYDSTLSELKTLMDATDGDGIAAEQARAWMANGGVDKAIWWMPIDMVAAVLKELYVARDACKQVIYEITGLSDILRGATDPNETLGAQKLKANSSSLRLQRMQREVQRYVRDIIRLLVEVIGENFSPETLAKMTGLQFPTNAQKQQIQLTIQGFQQQQQAPGQPPQQIPPEIQQKLQQAQQALSMPSWEDIMGVLQSDMQREYRVDIETDSTVAESLTQDMEGMREVITSVVEFWQGVGPAVQAKAVSMEAVKAITMSIVRRARMGLEVEDALESGMQEPQQQADPKAQADAAKQQQDAKEAQHQAALDQQAQQHEQQIAQREQQMSELQAMSDAKLQEQKQSMDAALEQQKRDSDAALERERMANEERLKQIEVDRTDDFNRWKVEQDNKTKIEVAEISAGATLDKAKIAAAQPDAAGEEAEPEKDIPTQIKEMLAGMQVTGGKRVYNGGKLSKIIRTHADGSNSEVTIQ